MFTNVALTHRLLRLESQHSLRTKESLFSFFSDLENTTDSFHLLVQYLYALLFIIKPNICRLYFFFFFLFAARTNYVNWQAHLRVKRTLNAQVKIGENPHKCVNKCQATTTTFTRKGKQQQKQLEEASATNENNIYICVRGRLSSELTPPEDS